jgi:hypothetical protein
MFESPDTGYLQFLFVPPLVSPGRCKDSTPIICHVRFHLIALFYALQTYAFDKASLKQESIPSRCRLEDADENVFEDVSIFIWAKAQ